MNTVRSLRRDEISSLRTSLLSVGGISGSLHFFNHDVHRIDLLLVVLGSLVALELEGGREAVVVNREKLGSQMHLLGLLKTAQLLLSCQA